MHLAAHGCECTRGLDGGCACVTHLVFFAIADFELLELGMMVRVIVGGRGALDDTHVCENPADGLSPGCRFGIQSRRFGKVENRFEINKPTLI